MQRFAPAMLSGAHAASATGTAPSLSTAMAHLAITEMIDGKNVDWLEPVTDERYQGGELVIE